MRLAHPLTLLASLACFAGGCSSSSGEPAPAPAATSETDDGGTGSGSATDDSGAPPPDAGRDATPPPNGSKGCGASSALSAAGKAAGLSVDVGAAKRTFALSVPTGYDAYRAYPLVFNFHSGGRTGASARDYFGFEGIAGDKAVFVYPDGEQGNWELDAPAAQNKDVLFFDALLARLEAELCIDTSRVFASGSSMGAYLTNQLGCRRGDVLRAIAPHAGGGPWETGGTYDAQGHLSCAGKPVAAMVFIGLADTNVSPTEGEKSITHWTWANGCTAATAPSAPSPCVTYQGCARPVAACRVPGVGHRIWNQGPKATWDFFASF